MGRYQRDSLLECPRGVLERIPVAPEAGPIDLLGELHSAREDIVGTLDEGNAPGEGRRDGRVERDLVGIRFAPDESAAVDVAIDAMAEGDLVVVLAVDVPAVLAQLAPLSPGP